MKPASRADLWRLRRLERFQHLEPQKLTAAERFLLWAEKHINDSLSDPALGDVEALLGLENPRLVDVPGVDYRDYLYPQWGTIRPGSALGLGLRFRNPRIGDSRLGYELSAAASVNGYQAYRLAFGRLPWTRFVPEMPTQGLKQDRDPFFLYLDLRYDYFPEENFFGPGPDSRKEDRSDFLMKHSAYNAVLGFHPAPHLKIALRAGVSQIDNGPGGDGRFPNTDLVFNDRQAPGLNRQDDFFELGALVLLDYRDTPGNPHKGFFLGASFQRFDHLRRNRFEFNRFVFDGRSYLPLGSPQRVLAVRFLTSLDDADGGAGIPFYLQRTLGGKNTLRGFRNWRFRDENLLHLSAEYRWEALETLELAVFYDAGKVFRERRAFSFNHLEKSIGLGLRFKTPEATAIRIDIARSTEGTRLYFTFGQGF